jgi:hypothetical protein
VWCTGATRVVTFPGQSFNFLQLPDLSPFSPFFPGVLLYSTGSQRFAWIRPRKLLSHTSATAVDCSYGVRSTGEVSLWSSLASIFVLRFLPRLSSEPSLRLTSRLSVFKQSRFPPLKVRYLTFDSVCSSLSLLERHERRLPATTSPRGLQGYSFNCMPEVPQTR